MVTGDDRSALDWLWRWNLGGEGGIIAALAGVSSPKSEGEEKVMSDPSWAQVSGPLAVHAGGSGLSCAYATCCPVPYETAPKIRRENPGSYP